MSWKINFFETSRGDSEVEIFLNQQSLSTHTKSVRMISLLKAHGPKLMMPFSRKITGEIYELRIRGITEIRIFYAFHNNLIYLLHAFQKKSQKIPKKELDTAKNRLSLLYILYP